MSDKRKLRSWLLATALLWMAIDNGITLWKARVLMGQGYGDFANFYTAGTLVRRGQAADLYNSAAQWRVQQEFSAEVKVRRGPLRYMRPPFEALLFSLFARWSYAKALLIWTGIKLVLLSTIPFVVARGRLWKEGFPLWATALLVLGTFPAFIDLLMGQDAVLLASLFAISFWQLATDRDTGAGFTLGLALFKFQLVIPFVAALWSQSEFLFSLDVTNRKMAANLSIEAGLLRYPGYLLALNQATGGGIVPENQMTLRGLITLFVGRSRFPGGIHWVLAAVALGAIVYTGVIWRKAGNRFLAEGFGLAAIVAIVTSYYAYSYDLLLLIVPLLAMLTRPDDAPKGDKVTRYLEVSGLLLLLFTPAYWFARRQLHGECFMALPLLALGVALARRLSHAGARVGAVQSAPIPDGPG